MKKQMLRMLFCLCMAMSLLATAALAVGQFTDVKSGDYFAEPVEWAVEQAITNGTSSSRIASNSLKSGARTVSFV